MAEHHTHRVREFFARHRALKWLAITFATLVALIALFLAFFDWNLLRPALARQITEKTGRQTEIHGDLKVHPFSWTPRVEVNGLTLANPDWADRKLMFEVQRLRVSLSLLRLLRGQIVLPQVELDEPLVNLQREKSGRASWSMGSPGGTPKGDTTPAKVPAIRSLVIKDGRLHVLDEVRKLKFDGSLVAADRAGEDSSAAFKIRANGSLNKKPFGLRADGGPLLDLSPERPYSFSAHLTAADIRLDTEVTVRKPFDLGGLDVKFVVSGNDLADVYYLTGLALPNTPKYRLAATVHVDGTRYHVQDLEGHLGNSDIEGEVDVENRPVRPKLTAKLKSKSLNFADLAPTLGHPASNPNQSLSAAPAGKPKPSAKQPSMPKGDSKQRLFPDADLQVERVRGMDADVTYHADSVLAPKLPMKQVAFHLKLEDGVLLMDPVAFVLDAGKFSGSVRIDAHHDVPESAIDMRIENVDLGEFKSATAAEGPIKGNLIGRVSIQGRGSSIHKLASHANGAISVVVPHGEVSDTLAELTGINVLRGLGLLIAKDQTKTEIRCGIVDLKADDGKLGAHAVYVDTTNVLITGHGDVDLANEALDLSLQGDPKKVRLLRLRSPIALGGTLANPSVGIKPEKLAIQAGIATALGVFLTPAAAALAFIDPGLAKDKNCATVMSDASQPLAH